MYVHVLWCVVFVYLFNYYNEIKSIKQKLKVKNI